MFTAVGRCAYRNFQRDRQLIYTDKSLSAFSDSSCQHACDVEREFVCRSYTFLSTVSNHSHVATAVEILRSHMNGGQQMLAESTTHAKLIITTHFFTVETVPTHIIVTAPHQPTYQNTIYKA